MAFIAAWDSGRRVLWQVGNGNCFRVKVTEASSRRENSLSAVCESGGIPAAGTQFTNIRGRWVAGASAGHRFARDRGAALCVASKNSNADIEILSAWLAAEISFLVVRLTGVAHRAAVAPRLGLCFRPIVVSCGMDAQLSFTMAPDLPRT